MDTLTQMALGAVIGQAVGYKKLGPKAAVYGALGGLIPDLDVIPLPYLGPYAEWLYHRQITHALIFAPLLAPLIGWLTWFAHKKIAGEYPYHVLVWGLALFTHPLLDALTVYGTQLFYPFSSARISIPAVSIIDPVYTLILFTALIAASFRRWRDHLPKISAIALALSTLFLAYGYWQNVKAERIAAAQMAEQNITPDRVRVYTTIFQPYLRRIVVRETIGDDEWLRVGFVSALNPQPIKWLCRKEDTGQREAILQTRGGSLFRWFSGDELSYAKNGPFVLVTDARYGTPGPSVFGFWGLEYRTNAGIVDVAAEPAYIHLPRDASRRAIGELFRAALGWPNDFLPEQDTHCPQ